MKILLWVIVGIVVVMWLLRSKKVTSAPSPEEKSEAPTDVKHGEPMLRCAQCGVHVPASEVVAGPTGAVFCSEAHRLQHARK